MTHDMPDGRPTKTPDGQRTTLIIVVLGAIVAALVVVLGVTLTSGSDDDQPESTGGGGSAETTQSYVFMAETDGALAMLDMTVGPAGQINGTHVFAPIVDDGKPDPRDPEPFGGTFTDGQFELTGLSTTRSAYIGTLEGDILTLNGTPNGISTTEWKRISSAAEFDKAVREHRAPPVECEQEGAFGCGES